MNFFGISPETWFPIVTLIVGVCLKAGFDFLSDKRLETRERNTRNEERLVSLQLRRAEFQHATLIELQDAIGRLGRTTFQGNDQDVTAFRASGSWKRNRLSDDVNEGNRQAQADINRLVVRLRDEQVRQMADAVGTLSWQVLLAESEAAAETAKGQMVNLADQLNTRIGILLRALDDAEDQLL